MLPFSIPSPSSSFLRTLPFALGTVVASSLGACSSVPTGPDPGADTAPATGGSVGSGGALPAAGGTSGNDSDDLIFTPSGGQPGAGGGPVVSIVETLPAGFSSAEGALDGADEDTLRGGFRLVSPLADLGEEEPPACANILRVLVRDFITFDHPDFGGLKFPPDQLGLVEPMLDTNRKPQATDAFPEVATQLSEWFANVEGVNVPYVVDLWLEPDQGKFVFDSSRFFPLDAVGTDEKQEDGDGVERNFGFTTELHTAFEYGGGETFTFRGDDDVFVFVNGALVVDLGGVHGPLEGEIEIDSLGLTVGSVYTFDLFQAERNPYGSNFRLETTLDFTECGVILPVDVFE